MMKFSFEGDFEAGKRYMLRVVNAEERVSQEKGTEYLSLDFEGDNQESAFGKSFFNTPKAAWRIKEWLLAFGFKIQGNSADVDPRGIIGIRFTAEFAKRKGGDGNDYPDWIKPMSVLPQQKSAAPTAVKRQPKPEQAYQDNGFADTKSAQPDYTEGVPF